MTSKADLLRLAITKARVKYIIENVGTYNVPVYFDRITKRIRVQDPNKPKKTTQK